MTSEKDGDCKNNQGASYNPVGDFTGLPAALRPYVSASLAINLLKLNALKKGHDISKQYKPVKGSVDPDYDVASCNHGYEGACTASLTDFTHLITIKRIK